VARRDTAQIKELEVRVMFEPNRLSMACIAQAYEHVAPVLRRAVASLTKRPDADCDEIKQRVVGGAS